MTRLNFRAEVKFVTNFNFRDDVFGVWVVGQESGAGGRGLAAGGRGANKRRFGLGLGLGLWAVGCGLGLGLLAGPCLPLYCNVNI